MKNPVNKEPVERVYPNDNRVKQQTINHHYSRYNFASTIKDPQPVALDLGCGSGYGTEILRQSGYKTYGVDISEEAIKYAKKHFPLNEFYTMKVQDVDFGFYDLITCFEMLEHIDYESGIEMIQKASASLKKGGIFLISVPRDENPVYNKFHLSHWDYSILNQVLKTNFKNVKILGQDWDTAKITKGLARKNDFFIGVCSND